MPCSERSRTALVLVALLACAGPVVAQGERVSRPMIARPGVQGGDVLRFLLTPDASEVLYFGDLASSGSGWHGVPAAGGASRDLAGAFDLELAPDGEHTVSSFVGGGPGFYLGEVSSAPLDGSAAPSVILNTGTSLAPYAITSTISPDSRWVVSAALGQLYRVALDGSAPVLQLATSGAPDAKVLFTDDSSRVVYLAGQELRSAPVDGSSPSVLLSRSSSWSAGSFALTPDMTRVAYVADPLLAGRFELYVRAVDGSGTALRLNSTPPTAGNVGPFRIAPDSTWVAFQGDVVANDRFELFRVALDGSSAQIPLSGTLVAQGDVQPDLAIAPEGERVFFRADKDLNERFELYSVAADGASAPIRLNGNLVSGGDVTSYVVPADGSRLAYRADAATDDVYELFSVPFDASAPPTSLVGALPSFADVAEGYQLDALGGLAFFLLDRESDDDLQFFLRRLDGAGALRALGGPLVAGGDVASDFVVSTTSGRVFFRADAVIDEQFELFSTTLAGPRVRLNAALDPGPILGDVTSYVATSSGRVVYRADRETDATFELHSAALDGPGDFAKLNLPLTGDLQVTAYLPTVDGRWTLFTTAGTTQPKAQLYAAPTDGSQPAHRVNAGPTSSGVIGFLPAPDGEHVLYVADQDVANRFELYSVPLDGSASALALNATLAAGESVDNLLEATASGEVVFQLRETATLLRRSLWSAPLDGSLPARLLANPGATGGSIQKLRVSPDGTRVVYVADQDLPGTFELYSVPIDGSAPPVRLNAPLVPGGDVDAQWFAISADSARVVFIADQSVNDVFTLHSAPLDASASALELVSLSGALDVRDFLLTPDSTRVVYRADQRLDESLELFRVALDGSSPAVRLNAPLLALDDVGDVYHVTPDSARVVYLADQAADTGQELYSVRLDLSSPPVKLSTPEGGALGSTLSPDGRWAAYARNRPTLGSRQLVLTSVDGSRAPELLTQLAAGRNLGAFSFTEDSRRLLYLADQETAGVTELFQCIVGRPLRRR